MAQLDGMEVASGVSPRYDTAPERFGYLIRSLHEHSGQRVAALVDEYDKPILDALETPEIARANRKVVVAPEYGGTFTFANAAEQPHADAGLNAGVGVAASGVVET